MRFVSEKHFDHWKNRNDLDSEARERLHDREVRLEYLVYQFKKRGFKVEEEYRGLAFGFYAERKKTWFEVRFLDHHAKNDWGIINWMVEKSDNIKHYNNAFDTLEELETEFDKYINKFDKRQAKKR